MNQDRILTKDEATSINVDGNGEGLHAFGGNVSILGALLIALQYQQIGFGICLISSISLVLFYYKCRMWPSCRSQAAFVIVNVIGLLRPWLG